MKRGTILCLFFALLGTAVGQSATPSQADTAVKVFWARFRTAVSKGDKETVASLSQFPIGMSYGIPKIRTRMQLLKRYREVFNTQTNAAQCFDKATPEIDAARPKEFSVVCKDAAGNEVVVYAFPPDAERLAIRGA